MPKGVHLRQIETGDLPALYQHQVDPESIRMAAVYPRSAEAFMAHWQKIMSDPSVVTKTIIVDDMVAGYVTCFRFEGKDAVGYWIARELWGQGIATRALTLLLEQVTVRPLYATTSRANAASLRVLQRCGFTITGYQHEPANERYPACEVANLILD